jgi:hypothetical protein
MKGVSTFEHEECHRLWFLLAKLKNVANRSYQKIALEKIFPHRRLLMKDVDATSNCAK